MYEFLIIYAIFCIATSATSVITLIKPVLTKLELFSPLNDIVQHKYLAMMIFFMMGIIFAPLLLIPSIITKYNVSFQDSLYQTLET